MSERHEYDIVYAPEALDHLRRIERKHHRLLKDTIRDQLSLEPDTPTRNRKMLYEPSPFNAKWALRCGPQHRLRVLYSILETERIVKVLAIGTKEGKRLFFGGQEYRS